MQTTPLLLTSIQPGTWFPDFVNLDTSHVRSEICWWPVRRALCINHPALVRQTTDALVEKLVAAPNHKRRST